jgi:hypothetical protein
VIAMAPAKNICQPKIATSTAINPARINMFICYSRVRNPSRKIAFQ